jgi:hypothetical protein
MKIINPHFQLILQMQSIVLICFSPVVSETTVQQLEDTIETYLKQFKELFPMVNVTKKIILKIRKYAKTHKIYFL